jgi:hypothetical protein
MAGEVILYTTEDGETRLDVALVNESVWLSAGQMAELFQRDKSVISRHIRNVFEEGELDADSVVARSATTAADGKTYQVDHYNLDVVISVGYRVKSHRGTQFRIWATRQLRDYIIKGFALDDERYKRGGDAFGYFDELLARIRDIRSSEKTFWRKVLDIYATSVDYDPKAEASERFFQTVQNKMHWAAHGHTAAEIIHARANAASDHMGMTNWVGESRGLRPKKSDAAVAKNYLNAEEIDTLNRIVNLYLEFAELQAQQRKPMHMADWISKLDQFLGISDREILTHAGRISASLAKSKADAEYDRWQARAINAPSPVEQHFVEAIGKVKQIEAAKPKAARKGKGDQA